MNRLIFSLNLAAIIIQLLFFQPLFSLTIGSYSVVSKESSITFPASDLNGANIAQGFAWLKNGFILQDQTTTCSLNLALPISGSIALNGGTLYLQNDMNLDNNASISSMGSIIGSSYAVHTGANTTTFPFSAYNDVFKSLTLFLENDLTFNGTVTIQGACTIDGNGNKLNLGNSGTIKVASGASLKLKNITIPNLQASNIQCLDNTATVTLDASALSLSQDFVFTQGSLIIQNDVSITGTNTFNFQSTQPMQITSQATLSFEPNTTFFYNPPSNQSLISFADSSSTLVFNNSTFHSSSVGTLLSGGTLKIMGNVNFTSDGTASIRGILLGNNSTSTGNINVIIFPASQINVTSGYVVHQNL